MKNNTQEKFVIKQLMETGRISRNLCLQNFITRLASIVSNLNHNEKWQIVGEYEKTLHGRDFIYKLISSPLKRIVYRTTNGEYITTKYEKK